MSDEKLKAEDLNDTNLEDSSQISTADNFNDLSVEASDSVEKQNIFKKIGTNLKNKMTNFARNTKKKFVDFGHSVKEWWKRLRGRSFKENMKAFGRACYNNKGWLWLLPIILLMAIFTFYPLVKTTIDAFLVEDAAGNVSVGIGNFSYVVQYNKFRYCLLNTLLFTFISVPISTLLALLISVGLNSIKWLQKAYQTIFFLPYLTNALAIGAVFATMFSIISPTGTAEGAYSLGLVNKLLGTSINWTSISPENIWANRFVVIIYEIWSGLPFKILILFGSLQNVNKQYYDAAKVDGANKFTTLWRITVPLISPMLSYLIVTGFIGGFKAYTAVVGIYGAEKVQNSYINTMVGYIYDQIGNDSTSLAAAGSLILFVIILIFTLINLGVSKKKVHY